MIGVSAKGAKGKGGEKGAKRTATNMAVFGGKLWEIVGLIGSGRGSSYIVSIFPSFLSFSIIRE